MLRLVRQCLQLRLTLTNHNVTFLRCFLHRNNYTTTLEISAKSGHHQQHNNNSVDRAATHRILRSYIRVPSKIAIRLSSTTNTDKPIQALDTDAQPTNQSPLSNFDIVKLHSWAFCVEQFGNLSIRTALSVRVIPTDPHDYPAADRAFIHLLLRMAGEDETKKMLDALTGDDSLWRTVVRCNVQYNDNVIHVTGDVCEDGKDSKLSKQDADFLWLVEVPMSYDVNAVTTSEGCVIVEQLENQTCRVQTEEGDIVTKKLKSDTVSLRSTSGNINCMKLLQGNITIATGDCGTITTDRLQGQDVRINAGSGAIVIKDVYSGKSEFKSMGGDINLGNLHGDVTVSCTEGNLKIGSIDGSVSADVDKGDASAYLAKHRDVNITCKQGDICIKMTPDVQTRLHLQASEEIDFPQELAARFSPETTEGRDEVDRKTKRGYLNGGHQGSSLLAIAQHGSIKLTTQSWFDSLQLQK